MIKYPKVKQKVRLWYRKSAAADMPYHNRIGWIIKISNRKGPINVLVSIRGKFIIVPRGNLIECE